MIILDSGVIIRVSAGDISKIGRDTQGVRIMKVTEGKVAVVAVTPKSDEEELDGEETGEEAECNETESNE